MAVLPPDPLFCLKSDMECVHSLCFLNNSASEETNTLLASTEKGLVYFWNTDTNRLLTKEKFGKSIQCIHSKGTDLILQEKEGNVKLFRYNESKYDKAYESSWSGGFCKSILVGNKFYIAQEKGLIDVIDTETWVVIQILNPNMEESNLGSIMCLESAQIDGRPHLLAGYESGHLILWCCQTGQILNHTKLPDSITTITFDFMTSRGICGCPTNILHVFQINKQSIISIKCTITIPTANGCSIVKLRPSDRKILVAGGWDGRIRVFSWKSLRQLATLDEHKGASISDIQFSGRIFAASGTAPDGSISLWSLYN